MPVTWRHYLMGVSAGEPGQPVAVSVLEQVLAMGRAGQPETLELRQVHLEQLSPGPMPDTALRLDPLWQELDRREESARKPALLVDVAGTGMMLARLLAKRAPIGVVVVPGLAERVMEDGLYRVPRRELAGQLLLAVQMGKFRTARTLQTARRFGEALQGFKLAPPSTAGDDVLAVMKDAADDRLVLAAGAACWWAARDLPGPYVDRPKANGWDYDPDRGGPDLILGADIGQAVDPSAIAVLEGFAVRHVERVPLGTAYGQVADRIAEVAKAAGATIAVDATGVGRAVVDMLRERGFAPIGVTLTSGRLVRRSGTSISIPRANFLQPLVAAVETGRLRVAPCPHAAALLEELATLRQQGAGAIQGRGAGHHADLCIAVALALWAQGMEASAR